MKEKTLCHIALGDRSVQRQKYHDKLFFSDWAVDRRWHPKQISWSWFKCSLSEVWNDCYNRKHFKESSLTQSERRQRRERCNQVREFICCGDKKGLWELKGSWVWRHSQQQKWQRNQWGKDRKRHTKTCPSSSLACFWTHPTQISYPCLSPFRLATFPVPFLTLARVCTPSH